MDTSSLSLHLSIVGRDKAIALRLKPGDRVVLGRAAQKADPFLLDLSPFGALELGVSRQHAALMFPGIDPALYGMRILDIASANGTYLNGCPLTPNVSHCLCDADEIRLGHLQMRVNYDQTKTPFLEHIRLHGLCSKSVWETNRRTWAEVLELARVSGWQSSQSNCTHIGDGDAHRLANALNLALPHLPDEPRKTIAGCFVPRCIDSSEWYFRGWAGKQKLRDLIAFCRKGAFKVETL